MGAAGVAAVDGVEEAVAADSVALAGLAVAEDSAVAVPVEAGDEKRSDAWRR